MDYICARLENMTTTVEPMTSFELDNSVYLAPQQLVVSSNRHLLAAVDRYDNDSSADVNKTIVDYDGDTDGMGVANETVAVSVELIKEFMMRHYSEFHLYTEAYVMTALACLGLIFNTVAIWLLYRDGASPKPSRVVHGIYIFIEQLFLSLALIFIQIRKYLPKNEQQLDTMNAFTTLLLLVQCVQPWLLYIIASYARGSLKLIRGVPVNQFSPVSNLVLIVPPILLYCCLYLPWTRIFLNDLFPLKQYSLCNIPMENHWSLNRKNVYDTDIFYVLVYCLTYEIIAFVFPFFMVASRNKFIIDSLQKLQQDTQLLEKGEGLACMALVVAITCNVYLASVTIKMALLSFYIFDFLIGYIVSAAVFFQYLNVLGNFLLIAKSSVHFLILVLFNWNVRYIVATDLYVMKVAVIDFVFRWKQPKVETSVEVNDVTGSEV